MLVMCFCNKIIAATISFATTAVAFAKGLQIATSYISKT
jgi:hypothetical protein